MTSLTKDLLISVRDFLQSRTFSYSVDFRHDNVNISELQNMQSTFESTVFPGDRSRIRFTRGSFLRTFRVNVSVYSFGINPDREDEVILLGEEIELAMMGLGFSGIGPDNLTAEQLDDSALSFPPFIPAEMKDQNVAMVIIPFVFAIDQQQVIDAAVLRQYLRSDDGDYHRDADSEYVAGLEPI